MLLEPRETLGELDLDALDRAAHPLVGRDVVRRGEQHQALELLHDLPRQGIDRSDPLDFVTEELDPDGSLLVRGEHLDRVAADAELVAGKRDVVALVLQLDEPGEDRTLVALLPPVEDEALPRYSCGPPSP